MVDTSNALAVIPSNGVDTYRMSTDAATICGAIVKQTASNIQGKKYVACTGWQAIAVAHGCAASSRGVERVDGGFRAVGEVRRMDTGAVIAEAEGFVGEDEPTWFGGESRGKMLPKRPDFAIRAMAQTRAISRACRSAFAHVVVLIDKNLGTTPAEEMQGVYDHDPESLENRPTIANAATNSIDEARAEIEQQTGNSKSVYQLSKERKQIATLAATATTAISMADNRLVLKAWWEENRAELREKLPEEYFKTIYASVEAKRDSLPAIAA
jgi:hypothetical protein